MPRYQKMLNDLMATCPEHYIYYFDVSFEETLKRHRTKQNRHEFGKKEIREWYRPKDHLGIQGEITIPEASSLDETIG